MKMRLLSRCKDQTGAVLVEFALVMPVLLLFFIGGVDLTRFILLNQKLEKATAAVADIVSQASSIQTSNLNDLMTGVDDMMQPYRFTTNARVIITSVVRTAAAPALPVVRWQYCGGGTMSATSRIGSVNGNATIPAGITLAINDDIIVAETFYTHTPIFGSWVVRNTSVYKVSYYKPRLGALSSYVSSCP